MAEAPAFTGKGFARKTACLMSGGIAVCVVLLACASGDHGKETLFTTENGCIVGQELCGDGLDQDCDGADLPCQGPDSDFDGFPQSTDCDDGNRYIYPGVSTQCSAACGSGTRQCLSNGTFNSCTCEPLCEARANGRCYYVSPDAGRDDGAGSFADPLKSLLRFSSESDTPLPYGRIPLAAGDVVYLMAGNYRESVPYYDKRYGLRLRNVHGTASAPIVFKNYPGNQATIIPSDKAQGIYVLQSSDLLFEGLEIRQSYEGGIHAAETRDIELRNLWVHDIDGIDNDNVAGVSASSSVGVSVHHSRIHDNYDRTNADTNGLKTENSRNLVFFGGGNVRILYNVIYQSQPTSAPKTGGCLTYKHAATEPGAGFEVGYNMLWNCFYHAIGGGTPRTYVHHNLILDSDESIRFAEYGGPCLLQDIRVEYNTVIGGSGGLSLYPYETCAPIGDFNVENNIFMHDLSAYGATDGIVLVWPYGPNAALEQVLPHLHFRDNCYFNSVTPAQFAFFSINRSAENSSGGQYGFSGWQDLGLDQGSTVEDPQINASTVAQSPSCAQRGYYNQRGQ